MRSWLSLILIMMTGVALMGCREAGDASAAGENGGPEAGLERLTVLFQRQKDPEQTRQNAEQAAAFLSEALGVPVETIVPQDYGASVQALVSERADAAYLSALPFLLARRDGGARLILAEVRPDLTGERRTTYDAVWVAPADSPLESMADVAERAGELRVCFTSRTSTSGFVMATLRLVRESILSPGQDPRDVFQSVSFGGGYTQALQEVLAGRADLAAVSHYTVEGPTADVYTTAEERAQLRVIARTPEVPTHLVAVRGGLSDEAATRLTEALLRLSDERPELLANVYGATELRVVDEDEHVRSAVEAIEAVGLPIDDLAG